MARRLHTTNLIKDYYLIIASNNLNIKKKQPCRATAITKIICRDRSAKKQTLEYLRRRRWGGGCGCCGAAPPGPVPPARPRGTGGYRCTVAPSGPSTPAHGAWRVPCRRCRYTPRDSPAATHDTLAVLSTVWATSQALKLTIMYVVCNNNTTILICHYLHHRPLQGKSLFAQRRYLFAGILFLKRLKQ